MSDHTGWYLPTYGTVVQHRATSLRSLGTYPLLLRSTLANTRSRSQSAVLGQPVSAIDAIPNTAITRARAHTHAQGFVSNMDEWMGAVDCIVTKAGPGTIAEAMIRGLPIMLSAFLPGQEVGEHETDCTIRRFRAVPTRSKLCCLPSL